MLMIFVQEMSEGLIPCTRMQGERRMSSFSFPCELNATPVQIGEASFSIWVAKEPERLLDELASRDPGDLDVKDERLPYWAELWPSARALAEAILTTDSLPAAPWLELGCGPGLPGVAARRRGLEGIWSDYMPEALALAALNAETEGCQTPSTLQIDWREPPDDLQVPWILAADVAYEARNFLPLLESFETLLQPNGEIWLSEPGRPVARRFFGMLSAEGWQRETILRLGEVTVWRLRKPSSPPGQPLISSPSTPQPENRPQPVPREF